MWGCLKSKDGYMPPQTIQKIGQVDGKTAKEIDEFESNSKEVLDFLQELKKCWVDELL